MEKEKEGANMALSMGSRLAYEPYNECTRLASQCMFVQRKKSLIVYCKMLLAPLSTNILPPVYKFPASFSLT